MSERGQGTTRPVGPPPRPSMGVNMEYAHPGTNAWVREAWAEIERYREALEHIADPTNHHHKPGYVRPEEIAREALGA